MHPLEGTHRIRLIRFISAIEIRLIRLIRCYFYFSRDADINPLYLSKEYVVKKSWKQCLYKPGSVSRAGLLRREPSVIYLLRKSPCVSSILPSTVAMVGRDALKRWYT